MSKKKPAKKKFVRKLTVKDLKKFNGGRPESCFGLCTYNNEKDGKLERSIR